MQAGEALQCTMRLAILLPLVTSCVLGSNCSGFKQTAIGFRVLSWLNHLEHSVSQHISCSNRSQKKNSAHISSPEDKLLLPGSSLASCLGLAERVVAPLRSESLLFGLPQGLLVAPLGGGRQGRGRLHLGKLLGPLVVLEEGRMVRVLGCRGEGRWWRDDRALQTFRYEDEERQLTLVNFEQKFLAFGGWRGSGKKVRKMIRRACFSF